MSRAFYKLDDEKARSVESSPDLASSYDHDASLISSSVFSYKQAFSPTPDLLSEGFDPLHDGKEEDPDTRTSLRNFFNSRGFLNILTLLLLVLSLLTLFLGYPLITALKPKASILSVSADESKIRLSNVAQRGLIDPDTPEPAKTRISPQDSSSWHLVFSDEFEQEGRSFYPGDDPYFEAVDIWYWGTGDLEWYSPDAVNTTGGALTITLDEYETHNKNFRSGMVQSWNKLCFQGGYVEYSAKLPGSHNVAGFWPGLWLQGNLGRPGYGATNEGMWPYSYDACDTGILPNQTYLNKTGPAKALDAHGLFSKQYNYELSWLPGMRFPGCTCPGEDHPGPNHNVGRSAPEIDILEANINLTTSQGQSSQSLQMAPFDIDYNYGIGEGQVKIYNDTQTRMNDYKGATIQEAISSLSFIPNEAYEKSVPSQYTTFGIQYEPDWKGNGQGAYITWYMNGQPTWTLYGESIGAVPALDISQRLVPREPMSLVINLAISSSFQQAEWQSMVFPGQLKIDYVRVYQKDGQPDKVSCDPLDYPTLDYINRNKDLYYNANLTVFPKEKVPKNRLRTGC